MSHTGPPRGFRQLRSWQVAYEFSVECYAIAKKLPPEERLALSSQIRRASSSVAANIAEGFGRGTQADFCRFLFVARGSLWEAESHLLVAIGVGHVTEADAARALSLRAQAGRQLNALIAAIRSRARQSQNR